MAFWGTEFIFDDIPCSEFGLMVYHFGSSGQEDVSFQNGEIVEDGISKVKVDAWDGAVAKQHEHANKTVLDGITGAKVSEWNSKAAGDHKHDITALQQASGYVVFNCGSATMNI